MMSELRKYGVAYARHQHMHQLEPEIHSAVLGNVGTLISFRVARRMRLIWRGNFSRRSTWRLAQLPNYSIYLKLMIDGAPSKAFSAITVTNTKYACTNHAPK